VAWPACVLCLNVTVSHITSSSFHLPFPAQILRSAACSFCQGSSLRIDKREPGAWRRSRLNANSPPGMQFVVLDSTLGCPGGKDQIQLQSEEIAREAEVVSFIVCHAIGL